ncbi:MAG: MFS transporter [Candidatus Latescibacteria bacterium]|nr:MFS transporter [Candidatus Latescibacterota bacterium]MCK5380114.1 MFS transporter [Candidatus Latescibacterota bacterium]
MPPARSRKVIRAWYMYDWANSAFATSIMATILPYYYRTVAGGSLPGNRATVYWGYTVSLALLLIAVSAPMLGAIGDYTKSRKRFLGFLAGIGAFSTGLLAFVGSGKWLLASVLFIVGNVGFAGANIFYDALLPHIAGPKEIDRISAKGYALGYLGGGLLLAIHLLWIRFPEVFFLTHPEQAMRAAFVSVGVWWMLFSIPILRRVPEPSVAVHSRKHVHPVLGGFRTLVRTFRQIRRYRELSKFLIAFWLYSDGIGTIIKMATIYGSEIGIGPMDLFGALLMTQFVGIPCSVLFGALAGRLGAKRAICLGLSVYTGISLWACFMTHAWEFWVLAFSVGLVQGGTQALSRSLYGTMVPKEKAAEFFGFYSVSSKIAGMAGPFLFALVGQITGSSRLGIVSLVLFFVAGGWVLIRVKEDQG